MRLIIADNCSKTREELVAMLHEQPNIDWIGEATEDSNLLELIKNQPADAVLLGYGLSGITTLDELIDQIRAINQSVRVLVLSSDSENAKFAFSAGADAFIQTGNGSDWLPEILHRI